MRQRPKILWIVSAGLIVTGLSLPLQAFVLYEHGLSEVISALDKLTLFNWLVVAGCFISATLVFRASSLSQFAVPALISLVAVNNYIVGHYATDFSPLAANLATVGFLFLNLPLAHPRVVEAIRRPERRWWLMAARHQVAVPILLDSRSVSLKAETFDVSSSGAFIAWPNMDSLKGNLPLRVCLNLGGYRQLKCYARVVRRSPAKGHYPAGIGIQFEGLPMLQRWELNRYLSSRPRG